MRHIFLRTVPALLFFSFFFPTLTFGATRSLTLGSSGSDVTALQKELISQGYLPAGNAIGYFGKLTQSAVQKFQCDKKIVCSGSSYGVAGPQTQEALTFARIPVQPATITGASLTGRATGAFEFSGWLPGWRSASSTKDVLPHLSKLKSVMPFGYNVSASGKLIDTAKLQQEPWPEFIAQAKAQKVRVIPSVVWGSGAEIHAVLSNTKKRIALEDEIAQLVKDNNFDGIDIDFEAKKAETINYFSTFLKGLSERMGNKWVYCTVEVRMPLENRYSPGATIPDDATVYANDYKEMNKYCDRIEIMAYDQGTIDLRLNAARSAPYAPVADPGWVESITLLAAQSISKNKLILGVPTYGYEYTVTPLSSGYQYKMLWPFNPAYALHIAETLGITPQRNSAGELGFSYDPTVLKTLTPTGNDSTAVQQAIVSSTSIAQNSGSQVNTNQPFNYLSWSDAQAIDDKVKLAHKLGIRGVAVFSLGGAEDQGMWNVLK